MDTETGEIPRHPLERDKVTTFFANRQRSLVAMEACGGAHHWARAWMALGHAVKLLPAKYIRPFVLRDKMRATRRPSGSLPSSRTFQAMPIKSEQQQACLALQRMRAQLMKMRVMQTDGLRARLHEFGIVLPEGPRMLLQRISGELAKAGQQGALPSGVVASAQD
jgi:transposase